MHRIIATIQNRGSENRDKFVLNLADKSNLSTNYVYAFCFSFFILNSYELSSYTLIKYKNYYNINISKNTTQCVVNM